MVIWFIKSKPNDIIYTSLREMSMSSDQIFTMTLTVLIFICMAELLTMIFLFSSASLVETQQPSLPFLICSHPASTKARKSGPFRSRNKMACDFINSFQRIFFDKWSISTHLFPRLDMTRTPRSWPGRDMIIKRCKRRDVQLGGNLQPGALYWVPLDDRVISDSYRWGP